MKRRFLLPALSAAALSTAGFVGSAFADCKDPFGKPNELLDFHLKIKKADWDKLLTDTIPNVDGATMVDSPACAGKFPKYKAEFRCGTTGDWIKIGVRKKKGTERGNEVPNKPPIKLDFNEDFPDDSQPQNEAKGQRWPKEMGENGFRKITMNNGHGNKPGAPDMVPNFRAPLLLTEHMALRLINREVPSAPQTAFAKLTVHLDGAEPGDYKGVYILAEDLDRSAIKKRFGSAAGRLIKASTPDCSPEVQYDDSTEGGKQPTPYESTKKFKEWADENVNSKSLEDAEKALDLDALLRQEAIREILVNGNDTITNSRAYLEWEKWGEGNNWYAFDPENGKRQYMPWDVDLAFGNQRGACTTPTDLAKASPPPAVEGGPTPPNPTMDTYGKWQCPPDMPITDFCNMPPKTLSTPRTFSRVGLGTVCNPNVKTKYLETMCTLINGPLSANEIIKLWDAADNTIKDAVYAERDMNYEGK
ncbi:MAG TPA: CotH kinase family protein, partial [Polyangia bacterium]